MIFKQWISSRLRTLLAIVLVLTMLLLAMPANLYVASSTIETVVFSDDFEYDDSLENHGWTIEESNSQGDPQTATDPQNLGNRAAYLQSVGGEHVTPSFYHSFSELPLQPGMEISIRFYDTGDSCGNCDVRTSVYFDDGSEYIWVGWYNNPSSFAYAYSISGTYYGEFHEPYGLRGIGWHTFTWRVEQSGGIDLLIDGNLVIDDLMGFATLSKFQVGVGSDPSTYSLYVDDFSVITTELPGDWSPAFIDEFCTFEEERWIRSDYLGPGEHIPTRFYPHNVIHVPAECKLQIRVPPNAYEGGEVVTEEYVSYGSYRVKMKASSVDPTIHGFFVHVGPYAGDMGHREIDIEFGLWEESRSLVTFTIYIDRDIIDREVILLGFDPSERYYEYGFDWYEDRVDFYVGPFRRWTSYTEISPDPLGEPLKLALNNWVRDWPEGAPPPLPQEDSYMLVDWVSYQPQYGELVFQAFSPVDLSIIDPDGLVIDMDTNEITGATYIETDVDSDGDLDDVVTIPKPRFGDYKIGVVPDLTAELTETYTLQAVIDGQTIVLAENTPISEIPDQGYIVRCDGGEITQIVPATTDFDPNTLNLKSQGKIVTAYVELPIGYDANQIDISSILLNGLIPALSEPIRIGDYDGDGIPDMMVKFDRAAVQNILSVGEQVQITVTGQVAGITFEGSDIIRVIDKGYSKPKAIHKLR